MMSKRAISGCGAALAAIIVASAAPLAALEPPGDRDRAALELLRKADKMFRGTKMDITMTMEVWRGNEKRTFKIHSVEKDRRTGLVRILEPRRDRGTAFLKTAGKLWMYTPKIRRTIPIPAAMMGNSFMGSDLSYDDMSRESDVLEDFDARYAGKEPCGNDTCWMIDLYPHEDAPVPYDRERVWITHPEGLYQRIDFIDDEGKAVKRMLFEDYRKDGGRLYPRRWVFLNLEEKDRKTVIVVDKIAFDHHYPDSFFSKGSLKDFRP